jgi:hypothetical protein
MVFLIVSNNVDCSAITDMRFVSHVGRCTFCSLRVAAVVCALCLRTLCSPYIACVQCTATCMQTGGSGSVEQAPMADEPDAKMSTFISESVSTSAR